MSVKMSHSKFKTLAKLQKNFFLNSPTLKDVGKPYKAGQNDLEIQWLPLLDVDFLLLFFQVTFWAMTNK